MKRDKQHIKIGYVGGVDIGLRLPIIELLHAKGYDICAIGPLKQKNIFESKNIPYEVYPFKAGAGIFSEFASFLKLYSIFKKHQFTIVHTFNTKPAIVGRLAAKLAGVPCIIATITGLGSLFSENSIQNKILRIFYTLGQRISCSASNMTIFQNQDDLEFFTSKKIASPTKVKLLRGSASELDTEAFSLEKLRQKDLTLVKEDLGYDSNQIRIFLICRLLKYKGIKEYLEASGILKQSYNNLCFYLVGPSDNTMYGFPLEDLEEYKGLVKYMGYRNDIPEILSFADILVHPTYYREGLPRILLEAACLEIPIVTTDMPGCREVVEDGVTGYLIPPKDTNALAEAIEKLILSKNLRQKMGQVGRERIVEEFSLEAVCQETLEVYNDLLQNLKR
jgi:glycosyltransferase involved in cell wall biosynthesis